jgi:hypothetical protein
MYRRLIATSRKLRALAGAVCIALALPGAAQAATEPATEAEALEQLRDVERTDAGVERIDPTLELRDLALALPKLNGAAKRQALAILSRPPDGSNSPYGGAWPAGADEKFVEMPTFIVHYAEVPGCDVAPPNPDDNCDEPNLADANANDIPDYVDATVAAVEDAIAVQNGELGWPVPKGDGDEGEPSGSTEEDRFDIYLSDLCDESDFDPCVFGYAQPDDSSSECNSAPFRCSAHLVVDNDYVEFGDSGGELGLRVTTAHEYNHVLQFNLDSNQDGWMFESTAVWSEEKVFPDDDDWIRTYMDSWTQESLIPITREDFHWYGSGVWNHWLEHGNGNYGPDVILNAWESSRDVTPKDYAVGAYDDAIKDEGGAGFPQEFSAFTAALAEWRTGVGGFPDATELPNIERVGKLKLGDESTTQRLDNTSFAQFKVNPKDAKEITLKGRSDDGTGELQWSIALVAREGKSTSGTVERIVAYSEGKKKRSVTLEDAQAYKRITAVVTNADGHVAGSKPTFGQFNYTRNDEDFKLKIR